MHPDNVQPQTHTRRRRARPHRRTLLATALLATSAAAAIGASATTSLFGSSSNEVAAAATPYSGVTRTYYVAADEVDWDYAPSGRNQITGKPFDDTADVFVAQGPDRIGHVYHKAAYHEYTDATFAHVKPRPADQEYLGQLGPTMHAVVGDHIKVVFRNNTHLNVGMHPHGVRYDKSSEGAPYDDGTSRAEGKDDSVAPGKTWTYNWDVPERAGPGPMDPSSVMWMYHSHTDEVSDTYGGLMGSIIVTRAGEARPDGTPRDVDREFINMYEVIDENQSPFLSYNIQHFAGDPASVDPGDEEFGESNLMHSINGFVYGNQPMMRMRAGEHVRWYMMGMGTEVDLHTPHFHGNTVVANGMRTDVLGLMPAMMTTADMVPDSVGTWLLHCHVNDHITAGMATRYAVDA